MSAPHPHTHDHPGDHHGLADEKRLLQVLILTAVFMLAEIAGGLYSGSLALLADAGHMFTDAAALALAWGAFRASRLPADSRRSYGYARFQVLAAFLNGLFLIGIFGWLVWEAADRIMTPVEIKALPMLGVAAAGLAVNLVAFRVLHRGSRKNLNLKAALLHVVLDLLGSAATVIAAAAIYLTGYAILDPILTVVLATLILIPAWTLIRRAVHILIEGTPEDFDGEALKKDLLQAIPGLTDVHHVHVWLLTSERPLMTLHATVADLRQSEAILLAVKKRLHEAHGIEHSTVQIETAACADPH